MRWPSIQPGSERRSAIGRRWRHQEDRLPIRDGHSDRGSRSARKTVDTRQKEAIPQFWKKK